MTQLTPPQPPPRWTHTAAEIRDITAAAIADNRTLQDKIAKLKPEECTLETVRRRVWSCGLEVLTCDLDP